MTAVTAYGWTFLVARGRRQGYRSLLVPDFLAESNEYGVLGQATGGAVPAVDEHRIARVNGLAAGDVVLTYQTHRLAAADLNSPGPLTDEFGRPLELLYGFVCRAPGIDAVDDADFAWAQGEALRTYQRFLSDESGFEPETSRPFVLRSVVAAASTAEPAPPSVGAATPAPLPAAPLVHAAPARKGLPLNAVLTAALIIAVSAAVWALVLRGTGGPVTKVTITGPTSSTVDCTTPQVFRATIMTKGKATVVYHWESIPGTNSAPARLEFNKAAEQSIQTAVQLTGSSGDKVKLTQALVVDEPNEESASREFELTCK